MIIGSGKIHLHANWVHSLKEKRMIVKSIIAKVKNKFNVSVAEVEDQDLHQSIVIGVVCVSNTTKQADSIIQNVMNYIEGNTEALVLNVETEII
ncbi:DUF503 domain-containing protein [Clostridium oceanicum]|uniref:DUF503 domain-containing protein n=1 Tax=Clostridium oceanicum TaxID=1543 RepID=A0ABN1JUX4_9CLOT